MLDNSDGNRSDEYLSDWNWYKWEFIWRGINSDGSLYPHKSTLNTTKQPNMIYKIYFFEMLVEKC